MGSWELLKFAFGASSVLPLFYSLNLQRLEGFKVAEPKGESPDCLSLIINHLLLITALRYCNEFKFSRSLEPCNESAGRRSPVCALNQ